MSDKKICFVFGLFLFLDLLFMADCGLPIVFIAFFFSSLSSVIDWIRTPVYYDCYF